MKRKPYDVFISYRREGGWETARLIYSALQRKGYRVAFDLEELRSGPFDIQLLTYIEECKDFILILSSHALDRCANEGDWVRQEIEHAIASKKNIVPILLRGFENPPNPKDSPEGIPDAIISVLKYNGISPSPEHFDSSMEMLFTKRLVGKVFFCRRYRREIATVLIGFALLVVFFWTTVYKAPSFPHTQEDKNLVGELIFSETYPVLENANSMGKIADDFFTQCEDHLVEFSSGSYQRLKHESILAQEQLKALDFSFNDAFVEYLRETPIAVDELTRLYQEAKDQRQALMKAIQLLLNAYALEFESSIYRPQQRGLLRLNRTLFLEGQSTLFYQTMVLLAPISIEDKFLHDFRNEALPNFGKLPFFIESWSQDLDFCQKKLEVSIRTRKEIVNKISELTPTQIP